MEDAGLVETRFADAARKADGGHVGQRPIQGKGFRIDMDLTWREIHVEVDELRVADDLMRRGRQPGQPQRRESANQHVTATEHTKHPPVSVRQFENRILHPRVHVIR
jgi:hypothetical protein